MPVMMWNFLFYKSYNKYRGKMGGVKAARGKKDIIFKEVAEQEGQCGRLWTHTFS
jgi:hypothetical protein